MPNTPFAFRAVACALAALLTFGLMRTLDVAAFERRQQVIAAVNDLPAVQRVHIVGERPPRS